jgi:hypoxanthine phosphoribosyltransferase
MKKIYYSWQDVEHQTQEILRQLQRDAWMPDYVVGLTRGGLVFDKTTSKDRISYSYKGVPIKVKE